MSWNYRIIRYGDGGYGLHEVYYDEAGAPDSWTLEPISFTCAEDEGPAGIIDALWMALNDASKRPVLPAPATRWGRIAGMHKEKAAK